MRTSPVSAPAPLVAFALLVGLGAGLGFASCSGTKPDLCWGGVVLADGGCVGKCEAAKCLANNTCVNNECALKCTGHNACDVASQRCVAATEDDTDAGVLVCEAYDAGGVGLPCPRSTECTVPERCLTAGPGDATAYCTGDCTQDVDCPSGFECGYTRDPHKVCSPDGGLLGKALCGTTTEACIDPAVVAASQVLVTDTYCLERKTCLKRTACSPCNEDLDCSLAGDRCIAFGPGKVCAPDCATNTDCEADKQCVSGSCLPWFGACAAPGGAGGFCQPCQNDLDCAGNFSCEQLHGFEKSCIDLRFTTTCATDSDCPAAPSGRHGMCLDERAQVTPASSVYHRCYAPYTASTNAFSCYYAPSAHMPWPDAG